MKADLPASMLMENPVRPSATLAFHALAVGENGTRTGSNISRRLTTTFSRQPRSMSFKAVATR